MIKSYLAVKSIATNKLNPLGGTFPSILFYKCWPLTARQEDTYQGRMPHLEDGCPTGGTRVRYEVM